MKNLYLLCILIFAITGCYQNSEKEKEQKINKDQVLIEFFENNLHKISYSKNDLKILHESQDGIYEFLDKVNYDLVRNKTIYSNLESIFDSINTIETKTCLTFHKTTFAYGLNDISSIRICNTEKNTRLEYSEARLSKECDEIEIIQEFQSCVILENSDSMTIASNEWNELYQLYSKSELFNTRYYKGDIKLCDGHTYHLAFSEYYPNISPSIKWNTLACPGELTGIRILGDKMESLIQQ